MIVLCLVLVVACGDASKTSSSDNKTLTNSAEPLQEPFLEAIQEELSHLNIPIAIPIKKLEQKINFHIPDTLHHDQDFKEDSDAQVKLTITKLERGSLKINADEIDFIMPLKAEVIGKYAKEIFGKSIGIKEQKVDFALQLHLKSKYAINSNWKLMTETTLHNIEWIKEPKLKLGFIKLKLNKTVERILEKKKGPILIKIDDIIRDGVDLKPIIAKVWRDLQKPIVIDKTVKKIWFTNFPQALTINPIRANDKNLLVDVGVDTYARILVSDLAPQAPIIPLPDLEIIKTELEDFDLNVYCELRYDDVNQVLLDSLQGQTFKVKGREIFVRKAEVYGSGENLVFQLGVEGDIDGTIYFKGTPVFDMDKSSLKVEDFDFDVQTQRLLVRVAVWLLNDKFKREIKKKLNLPLEAHIEQVPSLISDALEKGKAGEKISLDIPEMNLNPKSIVVQQDAIQILLNAQGNAKLRLDRL